MTNVIAFWLVVLIAAGLALDFALTGGDGALFLAREGLDLLQWVAFWR